MGDSPDGSPSRELPDPDAGATTGSDERYGVRSNRPESRQYREPMPGFKDIEVVDGEPVAAALIPRAVTAAELRFDDGATQAFDASGDTRYVEADGRPTHG